MSGPATRRFLILNCENWTVVIIIADCQTSTVRLVFLENWRKFLMSFSLKVNYGSVYSYCFNYFLDLHHSLASSLSVFPSVAFWCGSIWSFECKYKAHFIGRVNFGDSKSPKLNLHIGENKFLCFLNCISGGSGWIKKEPFERRFILSSCYNQ